MQLCCSEACCSSVAAEASELDACCQQRYAGYVHSSAGLAGLHPEIRAQLQQLAQLPWMQHAGSSELCSELPIAGRYQKTAQTYCWQVGVGGGSGCSMQVALSYALSYLPAIGLCLPASNRSELSLSYAQSYLLLAVQRVAIDRSICSICSEVAQRLVLPGLVLEHMLQIELPQSICYRQRYLHSCSELPAQLLRMQLCRLCRAACRATCTAALDVP